MKASREQVLLVLLGLTFGCEKDDVPQAEPPAGPSAEAKVESAEVAPAAASGTPTAHSAGDKEKTCAPGGCAPGKCGGHEAGEKKADENKDQ